VSTYFWYEALEFFALGLKRATSNGLTLGAKFGLG